MARPKGQPKLGGRQKGTPNKISGAIKDMVLEALSNKGGVEYLEKQADENPVAFMGLLGKIMPTQVDANITSVPAFTVHDFIVPPPENK